MYSGPMTEPRYVSVDGRLFEVLGPNDTRTSTHFLYAGRAYPVGAQTPPSEVSENGR